MDKRELARIESLMPREPELQSLWQEHLDLEQQLSEMDGRSHLTPGEEQERKLLQKRKLAGKDRIAAILARNSS